MSGLTVNSDEDAITCEHGVTVTVADWIADCRAGWEESTTEPFPFPDDPLADLIDGWYECCDDCADDELERTVIMHVDLEDPERAARLREALGIDTGEAP